MAEPGVIASTTRVGYEANHNTEAGLTENQKRTLNMQEEAIRTKRNEELIVVDDQGHVVAHDFGRGARVTASPQTQRNTKDNIVTHNHPRSIGKRGVKSIGSAFSPNDIRLAVRDNAREIRAVTPRYTFSMKRPANGWGMTGDDVTRLMTIAQRNVTRKNKDYLRNIAGWSPSRVEMAEASHYDEVNKEFVRLAKKNFGVDIVYRHRRVH